MRIAVWHNLPSGGGMRAMFDHVRGLVARGHAVEVWCPPTADRDFLPLGDLVKEHVIPLGPPEALPLRMINRSGFRSNVYGRLRSLDVHCQMVAREIGDRFDVLFAGSSRAFRVASIGRHIAIPSVLYLPEPYRRLYEAQPGLAWVEDGWALRRGWRRVATEERRNAAAFDRVLVNSLFSRESLLRTYGLDAEVCYLGVDTDRFCPGGEPGSHLIGVGAIAPNKNIEFVLRALGRVVPVRPRLIWVGNVAKPAYLEQLSEVARAEGVEFEARIGISDEMLIDLLQTALAMVYAPRLEPFGFAPLEANACGTPVVAVAEGGVRETVRDGRTGLLRSHDENDFADALQQLIADDDLRRTLGLGGRSWAEEFWSLDAAVGRLEGVLAGATNAPVATRMMRGER